MQKRPGLAKWIAWGCDPFVFYGLRGRDMDTDNYGQVSDSDIIACLFDMSRSMSYGLTGDRLIWKLKKVDPKIAELVKGFLDKTLRINLSMEQINRCLKKAGVQRIPIFRTSKGVEAHISAKKVWSKIRDSKHRWYASEELVGQRALAYLSPHHNPMIFYPNGKPLIAFATLRDRFTDYQGKLGIVLDGKVSLSQPDGEDDFAAVENRLRMDDTTNASLHVFDVYPIDTFIRGRGGPTLSARFDKARKLLKGIDPLRFSILAQYPITSKRDWAAVLHRAERDEWLGIVMRKDVPYESGETRSIRIVDL